MSLLIFLLKLFLLFCFFCLLKILKPESYSLERTNRFWCLNGYNFALFQTTFFWFSSFSRVLLGSKSRFSGMSFVNWTKEHPIKKKTQIKQHPLKKHRCKFKTNKTTYSKSDVLRYQKQAFNVSLIYLVGQFVEKSSRQWLPVNN